MTLHHQNMILGSWAAIVVSVLEYPGQCETLSKLWNLGLQAARAMTPCLFQRWLTQNLLPVGLVVMMVVKGDEWISLVRDCNQCMQLQPMAKPNPCPNIPPMVLQNKESEKQWKSLFVHVNALFHFVSCFELMWPSGCSQNRVRIQFFGQSSMRIRGMAPRRIGSLKDPNSMLQFQPVVRKKLSIFYSSTSTSQLTFPGHPCCKVAWMHLLGIGKKRLHRCKRTCFGKDGRSTVGRTLFELYRFFHPETLWYLSVSIPASKSVRQLSLRSCRQACRKSSLGSSFLLAYVLVCRGTNDQGVAFLQIVLSPID